MRLDPFTRPRRNALLLALCTVLGLIGLFVFDGLGDSASFVLAAVPLALGLAAWLRARKTHPASAASGATEEENHAHETSFNDPH